MFNTNNGRVEKVFNRAVLCILSAGLVALIWYNASTIGERAKNNLQRVVATQKKKVVVYR